MLNLITVIGPFVGQHHELIQHVRLTILCRYLIKEIPDMICQKSGTAVSSYWMCVHSYDVNFANFAEPLVWYG